MIFEDWELITIEKALDFTAKNNENLSFDCLKLKIEQVRSKSINKRYTLRTTDWCVENGKKSAMSRKSRSRN
jgi:hypothetical protein